MSGISNSDKLKGIQTAYRTLVQDALSAASLASVYEAFTSEETIDGSTLELAWLMNDPAMTKWLGKRVCTPLTAEKISTPVQSYQKTIQMPRAEVQGDRSGLVAKKAADMAMKARTDKGKLAFAKLISGFTEVGYDGVSFFSTAHPNGPDGATQSNRGTSALDATSFNAARVAMTSLQDGAGNALGINPKVLMVGPKLETAARAIAVAEQRVVAVDNSGAESGTRVAAASTTNVLSQLGIRVVVCPDLVNAYDDYWFLIDDTKDIKPIHIGKQNEPTPSDDLDVGYSTIPFYNFSVDFDAAIAFSAWQLAYGSIL